MAFIKGKSGNASGRTKGTPNKATIDLREWVGNFIDDNRAQIQKDWKSLDPKDRIILFEKLLKYVLPTLQTTAIISDFDKMTDMQLDFIIEELKKTQDESR